MPKLLCYYAYCNVPKTQIPGSVLVLNLLAQCPKHILHVMKQKIGTTSLKRAQTHLCVFQLCIWRPKLGARWWLHFYWLTHFFNLQSQFCDLCDFNWKALCVWTEIGMFFNCSRWNFLSRITPWIGWKILFKPINFKVLRWSKGCNESLDFMIAGKIGLIEVQGR